jgi:hypothetical protein
MCYRPRGRRASSPGRRRRSVVDREKEDLGGGQVRRSAGASTAASSREAHAFMGGRRIPHNTEAKGSVLTIEGKRAVNIGLVLQCNSNSEF